MVADTEKVGSSAESGKDGSTSRAQGNNGSTDDSVRSEGLNCDNCNDNSYGHAHNKSLVWWWRNLRN